MIQGSGPWYAYRANIIALAHHLVDYQDLTREDLLYYFEKPWKYGPEWEAFLASQKESK